MPRPRTTTYKQEKDIIRLSKIKTPRDIAQLIQLRPETVYYYLKKNKIKPIKTYKKRIRKPIKTILTIRKIKSILEEYFGGPLRLESKSLFSKTRINRGICLYIIRKYTGHGEMRNLLYELKLHFKCTKDVKYALSKNVQSIIFEIEEKIKNNA